MGYRGSLILILLAVGFVAKTDPLENTTWSYQISNNCRNVLKLKSGNRASEYDCELNYTSNGSYRIVKDTLNVSLTDDSHSEDGGKISYYTDQYLIGASSLQFIRSGKLVNGKWKFENVRKNGVVYKKIGLQK